MTKLKLLLFLAAILPLSARAEEILPPESAETPAAADESRGAWMKPVGVFLTLPSDSGTFCWDYQGTSCARGRAQGVAADLFMRFRGSRERMFIGPWVGQEVGRFSMDGASAWYGNTTLGGVAYLDFDFFEWYLGMGWSMGYMDFESARYETHSGVRPGSLAILGGAVFNPFRGTFFAPLGRLRNIGINLQYKFSGWGPEIFDKSNPQFGGREVITSASFGLFYKF
ncbi:MAG: hypothetical protein LBL46_01520 [Rickettsiales bacterium]|jgi:hypothetical protein|nr:hypothetical protein [Rickettsiales bacterium]